MYAWSGLRTRESAEKKPQRLPDSPAFSQSVRQLPMCLGGHGFQAVASRVLLRQLEARKAATRHRPEQ